MIVLKRCHSRGVTVPVRSKKVVGKRKKKAQGVLVKQYTDPGRPEPLTELVFSPLSEMAEGLDDHIPPGYWEGLREALSQRDPWPAEDLTVADPEPLFLQDERPLLVDSEDKTSHTLEEAKVEKKKDKWKKSK